MKILVPVKRVIDANVRVRIDASGMSVATEGMKMSLNPFDETAVEEAVRLKEAGKAGEIVAVSIGPSEAQEILRTAMAMGADRAILIETPSVDPATAAKILYRVCLEEMPDMVVAGRQAIDDDAGLTGPMLAGLLGWPQAVGVSRLGIDGGQATAVCEVERGAYTVRFALPGVVTVDLRLNTPRYVTLPGILKAKKKPLAVRPAADFSVAACVVERIALREPPMRQPGSCTDDVAVFAAQLAKALEA